MRAPRSRGNGARYRGSRRVSGQRGPVSACHGVHNHTLLLGFFCLLLTALSVIAPALSYRSGVIDALISRMLQTQAVAAWDGAFTREALFRADIHGDENVAARLFLSAEAMCVRCQRARAK